MTVEDAKSGASGANVNQKKLALQIECEQVVNKLLSLTLQVMKDEEMMNDWIHMLPTSYKRQAYKSMCEFEVYALVVLGWLYNFDATKESFEIALKHWGKAKVIFKLIGEGCKIQQDHMALSIASTREKHCGMEKTTPSGLVGGTLL